MEWKRKEKAEKEEKEVGCSLQGTNVNHDKGSS